MANTRNLTKPVWKWRKDCGRFRIAWISYKEWKIYGAWWWSWFLIFRHYPLRDNEYGMIKVGGYFQLTIFGLQIGYCYRKDYKSNQ